MQMMYVTVSVTLALVSFKNRKEMEGGDQCEADSHNFEKLM